MIIDELIKRAHDNAVKKGFYDCMVCEGSGKHNNKSYAVYGTTCRSCNGTGKADRNIGELLMLIVSELGEALEAHRNNRFVDMNIFNTIFNNEDGAVKYRLFEHKLKDTFEDELADVFIRLFDLCGYLNIEPVDFPHGINHFNNVGEGLLEITGMIYGLYLEIDGSQYIKQCIMKDIFDHLETFCEDHNVDIEKHIELKMKYNETREYKHGKRY